MKRLASCALALALMSFAFAGPAQAAHAGTTVGLVGCLFNGGQVEAPWGANIDLSLAWGVTHRGLLEAFRHSVATDASIDDAAVPDADSYWGPPLFNSGDPYPWTTRWTYPTGRYLMPGETMTVVFQLTLRFPVYDGVDLIPRGDVFSPALTCTITGSAA
jgi:hypothetical protein